MNFIRINGEKVEVSSILGPSPFEVSKAAQNRSEKKEKTQIIILKPKTTSEKKRKIFSLSPDRNIIKIKLASNRVKEENEINLPFQITSK
jgi:calcineurin-like phosphoesterase